MRGILLLVIAGVIAYANSISGTYLLDDVGNILNNSHIRHLWPPWEPFMIFSDIVASVAGRPILNFSFAINYAIHNLQPEGYHIFNIVIHILSAILIFSIMSSTFQRERLIKRFGENSSLLALAISILWLLHPLNTASVTYLSQRAESLMGLFILLTIYCSIRSFNSPTPFRWYAMAVGSYLLGMGVKEVAIVTPLLVLFYDRTFVSGSFYESLGRRNILYIIFAVAMALMVVAMVLGISAVALTERVKTSTMALRPISPIEYAMTQMSVLVHYLKLSFLPTSLVFHYWWPIAVSFKEVFLPASLIITLLLASGVALWKWPSIGFLGVWFFLILAPSSSIVPIPVEIAAEHRMYLPLLSIITLFVIAIHFISQNLSKISNSSGKLFPIFVIGVSIILGLLTYLRNINYHSAEGMWQDVITKNPDNPVAHNNFGYVLVAQQKYEEALKRFTIASYILPNDPTTQSNLGGAMATLGRTGEAILQFQKVLKLDPNNLDATYNLGYAYASLGEYERALPYLKKAYKLQPSRQEILQTLIRVLTALGRVEETEEVKKMHKNMHN